MPEISGNTLPPPTSDSSVSALGVDSVLDTVGGAEAWMKMQNGELLTNTASIGWEVKPKVAGKPSEDTAYAYEDAKGRIFLGAFDGVGKYGSGDKMAGIARDTLHSYAEKNSHLVRPDVFFEDIYPDISELIEKHLDAHPEIDSNAGTTGLSAVIVEYEGKNRLIGAAVGDSLGFVVRSSGEVVQLNQEETERQVMLNAGKSEEIADRQGNIITNMLGENFDGVNQKFDVELFDGDVVVFTTDGITGDRADQRLSGGQSNEQVIAGVALDRNLTPKQKAQKLVELATKKDDRTAIFLEFGQSWIDKFTHEDLKADMELLRSEMLKGIGGIAVSHELETPKEDLPKTRDELLFAPLLDDEGGREFNPEDEELYDLLVDRGDDSKLVSLQAKAEKKRLSQDHGKNGYKERSRVTKESLDRADRELAGVRHKDKIIGDALKAYQNKTGVYGDDLLKAIRIDPELRMVIGRRLRDIANSYPYATRSGITQKSPDAPGYDEMPDDMTSKEYISLLMLAMIDGSFKPNTSDEIEKDKMGSVVIGNHRKDAQSILMNLLAK